MKGLAAEAAVVRQQMPQLGMAVGTATSLSSHVLEAPETLSAFHFVVAKCEECHARWTGLAVVFLGHGSTLWGAL